MRMRVMGWVMLAGLGGGLCSCGVVMMPVRVVGAVATHSYKAGEKAVAKSAKALDEHNAKKQAAAKAQTKEKAADPTQPAPQPEVMPPTTPTPPVTPAPAAPVGPPPPLGADPATLPPLPE